MKRILALLLPLCAIAAQAQDVIVKHDGSTILSKVTEIGTTEVKYKKFSNQNGPTYTILKTDIQAINYENGDKDTFADAQQSAAQQSPAQAKQQIIEAKPAADNAELISRYNRTYEHGEAIKDKEKRVKYALCILGVGEHSVLSTDDVTIEFRQEPYEGPRTNLSNNAWLELGGNFFVQVCNKTDQVIYLDLGRTFRVMKDGLSKVYYDNSQTTINKGNASGGSVNLGAIAGAAGIGGALGTLAGGVNVGGANSSTVSKVYAKQQIVAIPPHGKVPLEKFQREWINKFRDKSEVVSEGEILHYDYEKGCLPYMNRGEKYIYTESESPYHADYTITYSKDSDFKTSYTVRTSAYIRELIGCYWEEFPSFGTTRREVILKRINKWIPDYNDYTIVGRCSSK